MIIPKPMDIIAHKEFMDVAIVINKATFANSTGYIVRGLWFNLGYKKTPGYLMNYKFRHIIKRKDMKDWLLCINSLEEDSLRDCNWIPLDNSRKENKDDRSKVFKQV